MPKTRDYMREAFGYIKNPTGLLVMNSIMNGGVGLVYNVSEFAVGWRRSNNIYCGCKEGSFRIYPKTSGFTMQDCVQGFYEWLGNVFQEIVSGSRTWAGMIYSMDLSYKGDMRRRSFEDMYNAIKGQYTEMVLEGSPPVEKEYFRETAWYLDQDSIDQFGRKEYIFQMDGFPQAAVEQKAQALIRSWGRPYPRLVDLGSVDEDYLDVKVLGFAATGNWRYVTAQDGLTGNANVWISNIMATDCQFLTAGSIVENTIQIKRTNNIIRRGIDTMDFVAELGGANYMPWQIYVDHRQKLNYRPIDLSVKYYLQNKGNTRELKYAGGEIVNPFQLVPGVVRDVEYPVMRKEQGDPLMADARDALIEEIEVSWDGTVYLRNQDAEDLSIISAQQEYEKMLADEAEREAEEADRLKGL